MNKRRDGILKEQETKDKEVIIIKFYEKQVTYKIYSTSHKNIF